MMSSLLLRRLTTIKVHDDFHSVFEGALGSGVVSADRKSDFSFPSLSAPRIKTITRDDAASCAIDGFLWMVEGGSCENVVKEM